MNEVPVGYSHSGLQTTHNQQRKTFNVVLVDEENIIVGPCHGEKRKVVMLSKHETRDAPTDNNASIAGSSVDAASSSSIVVECGVGGLA